jgi:mRNA interferase MazF
MVKPLAIVRGEVWLVELDPTKGSEIRKTRPCLIVSPDSMNRHLRTVTGVPLTSGGFAAPFRVALSFEGKNGFLLADQMRSLDKSRLRKCLGRVEQQELGQILLVLRQMFED